MQFLVKESFLDSSIGWIGIASSTTGLQKIGEMRIFQTELTQNLIEKVICSLVWKGAPRGTPAHDDDGASTKEASNSAPLGEEPGVLEGRLDSFLKLVQQQLS